jgi:thioredoxin-like negative regulator of GroEL
MNQPVPPIPDDEMSAEEVRQQRRRLLVRRLLTIGLPVLAAIAIGTAVAIPRIKDWRARQFTAEAEQLLAQNKLQEAFNNAASAMQMRPGLPDVRRTYAKVLLSAGKAEGLSVLRTMAEDGSANTQDRLDLTDAALRFGDVPLAEREAFQALQSGERNPEALLRLARVRLAQQRIADAVQALRESREAGGNTDATILLARLQLAANTPESIKEALDLLRPISKQQDEDGLEALLVLVASPSLQSEEGQGWVDALRNHPKATDEQKLAAASAEIQLDPRRYADIVREARSLVPQYCPEWTNLSDADPGMTLVQLFAWMTEMTIYRLNRVPDKTYVHFLNFIGEDRRSARPATVPLTFYVRSGSAESVELPAYSRCSTKQHKMHRGWWMRMSGASRKAAGLRCQASSTRSGSWRRLHPLATSILEARSGRPFEHG